MPQLQPIRLSLKQLLVLTATCAAFFALLRILDSYSGPLYEILLLALAVLLGVGGALASVVAAGLSLGKCDATSTLIGLTAIGCLALAMAVFGLWQTDSSEIAGRWFMRPIVEAIVTGSSIAALRKLGYGLSKP